MMSTTFLTIFWREMIRFTRFKAQLFSSLVQPILWMAFFGVAMSSTFDSVTPPGGPVMDLGGVPEVSYLTFMGAGIIAMTALFTTLFGGMSIVFDKKWGIMREIMASPMPRSNILFGITLAGIVKSFIQAIIIIIFGLMVGVKFFGGFGPLEVLLSFFGILAFVALFAAGFVFLSSAISMKVESFEGVQGFMTLMTMPLFFTSNALYPSESFPPLLKAIATVNPLTHLVTGVRYFALGNEFAVVGQIYSYSAADVLGSFLFLLVFSILTYLFAWRTFDKAVVV